MASPDISWIMPGHIVKIGRHTYVREVKRNDPPWGEQMSKLEYEAVHPAWVVALKRRFRKVSARNDSQVFENQCGGCRFYMPIEGASGADWGACGNPKSNRCGVVVFEHHGCREHSLGQPAASWDKDA